MKVKATKKGFHNGIGKLFNPGDEFEVDDNQELGSWMEKVEEPKKPAKKAAKASGSKESE